MDSKATFRTKARTIDHLGRGQIADAPTAVSELWKNAYDAYSRKVELHIFDGKECVASIIDNGCGMSSDDLQENWLVVGTENKVTSQSAKASLFGLPHRQIQGEKGIGRLSAAFLSPMTLVVSKKTGFPYTAILVDWRFFENPFLLISDIELPIVEFSEIKGLLELYPQMAESLKSNLREINDGEKKSLRVLGAWESFDELEKKQHCDHTTRDKILNFDHSDVITWDHLYSWWTMLKETPEEDFHGTAMFFIQANTELASLVQGDYEGDDAIEVKTDLRQTLISFIDPYTESIIDFDYAAIIHKRNSPPHNLVDSNENFNLEEFHTLEHCVEGEFDAMGVFRGKIKAFGVDRNITEIKPARYLPQSGRDHLGPFKFCIGTFEQDKKSTTHSSEEYEMLYSKAEQYGGICVYRDGLRVMPYGRSGADIFEIEFSRSKHAGRYFFSYRRSFGRVSFTSINNPNLKDKSGREGLVDNKARRQLERLVKNLLQELARSYFGTDSNIRTNELPSIKKKNAALKKAAETARKRNARNFSKTLKANLPKVLSANKRITEYYTQLEIAIVKKDIVELSKIKDETVELEAVKDDLRLPNKPSTLDDDEQDYRTFRDSYQDFCLHLEKVKQSIAQCEADGLLGSPRRIALNKFHSNESRLSHHVDKKLSEITEHLNSIKMTWTDAAREDRKLYNQRSVEFVSLLGKGKSLEQVLNMLDREYTEIRYDFDLKYTGIINSLEQLVEGVDIEGAFLYADQENARLEEKIQQLNSVAQLGISVEIIGHELESLESQVTSYLRKMPAKVRELTSYKLAFEAHRALVDRLRFLTPLKKTAYRTRTEISGSEIETYLKNFFGDTFEKYRIHFIATESFQKMRIRDLYSRIYPTFINLVNNALYWVQYGDDRKICLDFQYGKAIVSDTGKGVDSDDIQRLFELFFTKRSNGRGIGLYLCRQNLAVAHHKIRYASDDDPKVYSGANFIIEFNGVQNV